METVTMTADKPLVKGFDPLLTVGDLAVLMSKPTRFVLKLIKTGALRGIKLGGNSWRVRPEEWRRFTECGATGYRHARPSGGPRAGMWGRTGGGAAAGGSRSPRGAYPKPGAE